MSAYREQKNRPRGPWHGRNARLPVLQGAQLAADQRGGCRLGQPSGQAMLRRAIIVVATMLAVGLATSAR